MMGKLVFPACRTLAFVTVEIIEGRKGDILENTFLGQHGFDLRGDIAGLRSAEEIDDIVEVARAGAFFQRTDFLSEYFGIGITLDVDSVFGVIAIVVSYRGHDRFVDEDFVCRKVKFDFRHGMFAAESHGTAVVDATLTRINAAWILEDLEFQAIGGYFDAGALINPARDFREDATQKIWIDMVCVAQREVEVF